MTNSANPQAAAPGPGPHAARNPRKNAMMTLAGVVVLGALAWLAYEHFWAGQTESTDNAYVQGDLVQVTAQIGGTVQAILANDTDLVDANESLVRLDAADAQLALQEAQARLGQTVRQVRTLYANNAVLQAQLAARQAEQERAQNDIEQAQADAQRRARLVEQGNVSREEFDHAQEGLRNARSVLAATQASVDAAREQLHSNQAQTQGVTLAQHPTVLSAMAHLRAAWLNQERTEVRAPLRGYVAKRTVQIGQRVQPGTALMTVVPLERVWVDANFKEVQLRNIRIGQPVRLVADMYGKQQAYQGTVAGLGVGTGAAFALLPAQNATGNWIKVVQRVPVRIMLDPEQLKRQPLRVGLSMTAEVDVSQTSGATLSSTALSPDTTVAPINVDTAAEADIRRILAAHGWNQP